MNKIVRSTSATLSSIKRSNVHVQICDRCSDSACCFLGRWKASDTRVLAQEYQNLNVSLAHQGPRVRETQTLWRNLAMNKFPSVAAAVVLSVVIVAPALARAVIHKPGLHAFDHPNRRSHAFISKLARNREAAMSAMAQARTNESSALPPEHRIEGREVAAPPSSVACVTDQGPSQCGEPMWIYGSPDVLARYRNAF
jgi:hypothetical protein